MHGFCYQAFWQSISLSTLSVSDNALYWSELVLSNSCYSGFESNMLVSTGIEAVSDSLWVEATGMEIIRAATSWQFRMGAIARLFAHRVVSLGGIFDARGFHPTYLGRSISHPVLEGTISVSVKRLQHLMWELVPDNRSQGKLLVNCVARSVPQKQIFPVHDEAPIFHSAVVEVWSSELVWESKGSVIERSVHVVFSFSAGLKRKRIKVMFLYSNA